MTGCARRNADRELARVIELLNKHILAHEQFIRMAKLPEVVERYVSAKRSLEALRSDLVLKAHRERA